MLQTELWENREQRSLFLCVPFESPHLHHQNRDKHLVRNFGLTNQSETPPNKTGAFCFRDFEVRVQIGTAPRRRSLLWFLKRNFSYLVQKSRPKVSDLLKPPFYKCQMRLVRNSAHFRTGVRLGCTTYSNRVEIINMI